jgi:polyhydroxybutyrate depolymerase
MKRSAFFMVVGSLSVLAAGCSGSDSSNAASHAGGSAATNTGVGGSGVAGGSGGSSSASGGTTSSGDSSNTGGSGGKTDTGGSSGAGGTTTNTSGTAVGGTSGSGGVGGTTAKTTKSNTSATGGSSSTTGGVTGSGGAKGGATGTGGAGTGGKTGVGGATGTGGAGTGGKTGVGGATGGVGTGGKTGVGGTTAIGTSGSTPSTGCSKTTTLKSGRASITVPNVADTAREYILTLPANYDPNHAYRLVFAWHPWMGSAQMIQSGKYYGLQTEANNDAIFVAPEGLNFTQNGQTGLGWGNASGEDVTFYHTMLDLFRSELCIDEDRIFATGFSFGAMFSFTLGCTAESMLRAIIPMAGNTFTSGGCASGTRQVAVMAFIGLQDSLLSGHQQAVSAYATRDGCDPTTETMSPSWCDGLSSTNLPCTCVNYQGCDQGYPVVSCEYTAGHQQAPNPGPIWDFIAQF